MVIDDDSLPPLAPVLPEPLSLEDRLATPMDRLAAAVADFVIVSPMATLAMSPFRRLAEEAQLQGSDERWMIATASGLGAGLLIIIAYQTLSLMKWRATPGKRLLGLSVESLWHDEGTRMRPQAALLRSLAWCAEAALCGMPWIAVIGNERRRPFHDRLADTIVLSKRKSMGPPGLHEMSLASGLVGAFFTSLLIVVAMQIGLHSPMKSVLDQSSESVAGACEAVDRAESSWVAGLDEKKPSRMSIALSLYEADSIDEDCLKHEADFALWKSEPKELAYLARGLAEKTDDELSQSYLDKACDGRDETDACRALALLNVDELPEDPVEAKAAQVQRDNEILSLIASLTPKSEPFLRLIAIRELITRHQSERALELIDSFAPQKDLAFFLSSERMKTLWALNRKTESRLAMKSSIGSFEPDQRVALTRWFCQTEIGESGCSTQAKAPCDLLAASVDHDQVLLGDPDVTLAYIRGETCSARLNGDKLRDLKNEMPDASSQGYVEALIALEDAPQEGVQQLRALSLKDDVFTNEARAKLIDLARSEKELSEIREDWLDDEAGEEGWSYVGRKLMARYNELKAWDQTIEIGFKMGEGDPLDQQAAKQFIIAAYRSGQTKMALSYLQTYFEKSQEDSLRAPASSDGFDQIAREIHADVLASKVPTRLPAKKKSGRAK
jgi:uncharacterized RDD family membrane protein YckC